MSRLFALWRRDEVLPSAHAPTQRCLVLLKIPVCAGAGIGWLYPLLDGAPPVGWEMAARYLVLPALLVGAQYASSAIISPPVNPDDDSAKTTKARRPALVT